MWCAALECMPTHTPIIHKRGTRPTHAQHQVRGLQVVRARTSSAVVPLSSQRCRLCSSCSWLAAAAVSLSSATGGRRKLCASTVLPAWHSALKSTSTCSHESRQACSHARLVTCSHVMMQARWRKRCNHNPKRCHGNRLHA